MLLATRHGICGCGADARASPGGGRLGAARQHCSRLTNPTATPVETQRRELELVERQRETEREREREERERVGERRERERLQVLYAATLLSPRKT